MYGSRKEDKAITLHATASMSSLFSLCFLQTSTCSVRTLPQSVITQTLFLGADRVRSGSCPFIWTFAFILTLHLLTWTSNTNVRFILHQKCFQTAFSRFFQIIQGWWLTGWVGFLSFSARMGLLQQRKVGKISLKSGHKYSHLCRNSQWQNNHNEMIEA